MPPLSATPAPLRTDATEFTRDTMARRVPEILRAVLIANPDYPEPVHESVLALADDLAGDAPLPPPNILWQDYERWAALFAPHEGTTWLHTGWFFAEIYVYRLLLDAVRYRHEDAAARDPFAPEKLREMASPTLPRMLANALALRDVPDRHDHLSALLYESLWGNRIDLSLSASAALGTVAHADDLLVDERDAALQFLLGQRVAHVHIITDNAGTELALDLALVDALLDVAAASVTLHMKHAPMFVSDATPHDLALMLDQGLPAMPLPEIHDLAGRLMGAARQQRLRVTAMPVWNRPSFLWALPPEALEAFAGASLVITKGDLNYRRLCGDALWEPTTPFAEVTRGFPYPLLALRTLKSEPIVGLAPGQAQALDAQDMRWRLNGRRGVIQFRP